MHFEKQGPFDAVSDSERYAGGDRDRLTPEATVIGMKGKRTRTPEGRCVAFCLIIFWGKCPIVFANGVCAHQGPPTGGVWVW